MTLKSEIISKSDREKNLNCQEDNKITKQNCVLIITYFSFDLWTRDLCVCKSQKTTITKQPQWLNFK